MNREENKIEISREYIKEVADSGHYIEAIVLVHVVIEAIMNKTFMTVIQILDPYGNGSIERMKLKGTKDLYPLTDHRYKEIASVLVDMGVYSSELYGKLKGFNALRNKAAHRLLRDLPTERTLKNYLKAGLTVWDEVTDRSQDLSIEWRKQFERRMERDAPLQTGSRLDGFE